MQTYTIYLGKGGVLKTQVVVELARYCASLGKRTLVVDTDYQGDASNRLGVTATADKSLANVLRAPSPARALADNVFEAAPCLWVAPASLDLADVEADLEKRKVGRMTVLRNALRNREDFDVVVVDCPTSLNYLTFNALLAGGGQGKVIVPCEPEPACMRHLVNLYAILAEFAGVPTEEAVQLKGWNALNEAAAAYDSEFDPPTIAALLATKVETRALLHRAGVELLRGSVIAYGALTPKLPEGTFAEVEAIEFPPFLGSIPKTKAASNEAVRAAYAAAFSKLIV